MSYRYPTSLILLGLLLTAMGGCILGNRPTSVFVDSGTRPDKRTYYLDGAGNLGFGIESVPLGLADAGYDGHVRHFIWTTYLGTVADQMMLSHNRRQAGKLASEIEDYLRSIPDGHVNIIALSAGTGIAVFALEDLAPHYTVDNVVLLSSSLSANYDLTAALEHVRGGIYFFWSPNDPILREVVPILGTVDRRSSSAGVAGIYGSRPPAFASDRTRELYRRKVHNIRWGPNQVDSLIKFQHAGSTQRSLIRDHVAPIIVRGVPEEKEQIEQASPAPPTAPIAPSSGPRAAIAP